MRWPWERRRVAGPDRWAEVFAPDLLLGCDDLFSVYGVYRAGGANLTLPISIPIGPDGLVLLEPGGPLEAPRVPATLTLRLLGQDHVTLAIDRNDGEAMFIPGVVATAPLRTIVADVTGRGLHLTSPDGELRLDEVTGRAFATALLITLRMKLTKARRPDPPAPWHELVDVAKPGPEDPEPDPDAETEPAEDGADE